MTTTAQRVGLLGLGCNVGERRAQLQAAVSALPHAGVTVLACSSTYDTDPVGEVTDQPTFLNACTGGCIAFDNGRVKGLLDGGRLRAFAEGPRHCLRGLGP